MAYYRLRRFSAGAPDLGDLDSEASIVPWCSFPIVRGPDQGGPDLEYLRLWFVSAFPPEAVMRPCLSVIRYVLGGFQICQGTPR